MGSLKVPNGLEPRILFNISSNTDSSIHATMDSLDQGAKGIPVEIVIYKNGIMKLEVNSLMGIFEGTLKADGKSIDGKWKQAGLDISLVLYRIDKAPDLHRKQDPVKPYPYVEEEIIF